MILAYKLSFKAFLLKVLNIEIYNRDHILKPYNVLAVSIRHK